MSKKSIFIITLVYLTIICLFVAKVSVSTSPLKVSFGRPILGLIIWTILIVSLSKMTLKK